MVKQSDVFLEHQKIEAVNAGAGVTRQILGYDESIMMVKVTFKKGAIGAKHSHPHVQSSYIASGKFEVSIGETTKLLQEGDGYFVPPNVIHGVVCLQDGVLVDSFTPVREDFLA